MNVRGCSPNAAFAYDFLVGKGLSATQAAAVIGNLEWESGLNPRSDVPDPTKSDPSARGNGIASWGPPRWRNLLAFAGNRDPRALDTQLDFLWSELPSHGFNRLLASTDIADATTAFQDLFENPNRAKAHAADRIQIASNALNCLSVRTPIARSRPVTVAISAAGGALVAAIGYGIYKALSGREPEPPEPEPYFPSYRPVPTRPPWRY
jgi:hypothetical protein